MNRARNLIEAISKLRITESRPLTYNISRPVKTNKGPQILINDAPVGNITFEDAESDNPILALDLFGETLRFNWLDLNFKDPYSKLSKWDAPIIDVIERHPEEYEAISKIGADIRRKAKETKRNSPEAQQERSAQVLKALQTNSATFTDNGYAKLISSITQGSKPFEYNINYQDGYGTPIKSITIDLSDVKDVWSSYLSGAKLRDKLTPIIIDKLNKTGYNVTKIYWGNSARQRRR